MSQTQTPMPLSLRIPEGLKVKLQEMAAEDNRSLSNFILTELRRLVDEKETKRGRK